MQIFFKRAICTEICKAKKLRTEKNLPNKSNIHIQWEAFCIQSDLGGKTKDVHIDHSIVPLQQFVIA